MDYVKERQEAIDAGRRALRSLREAKRQLSVAKGLGWWDLLGGGSFVSIAKHFKINNAKNALSEAKSDLRIFSRELSDLSLEPDIAIGDFLAVFDMMDSFFADVLVQSRLSDASRKVDETIAWVEDVLRRI
jgi:hypothetical protein